MAKRSFVAFLSDYGLQDEFVGVCHGVILGIASDIRIIDVHHYILRQQIRHGAIVLQQSVRYLPPSVHLAVVDPSVGSGRKAVAIESEAGEVFVGPDNGLMLPAASSCGGVARAFEISNEDFLLTPVSRTFQGRDVFAPAAAHIAKGVDPSELGPSIAPSRLVEFEIPEAWSHDDHLHAEVLQVDRFGNLQLNFDRSPLEEVNLGDVDRLEIRMEGHRLIVRHANTFSDVSPNDFVLVEDSYGQLSLAVNNGDAAARLRAHAGSTAIVGPPRR
ncbi:MAG: SAM-dependent chlorinase/fluorinase [Actinobacteria bacterium]|nr:SAM-dependent chlorinase/fluorinase [Actinomycetota bacterium]